MISKAPREYTQAISLTCIVMGMVLMMFTPYTIHGVAVIGFSCWILMMSESVLHAKVQSEMSSSLEKLRKRQAADIQELLYFLRQSQLSASPLDSLEGAKKLCEKTDFPSMVVSNTHQIVNANEKMHKLLGWDSDARDLNGTPVYLINNAAVLSHLGGLATKPEIQDRNCMATSYVYVHKSGEEICGQLVAHKIKNEGFFAVFHPSESCVISRELIEKLVS